MKRVLTSFQRLSLGYGSGFIRRVLPRLICCKLSLRLLQPSRRVLRGLRGRHRKRSLNVIAYLLTAEINAEEIPHLRRGEMSRKLVYSTQCASGCAKSRKRKLG